MARVYANVKSALLSLFSMFLFKIIYPIYCKNLNQNLDTLFLLIASSFSQKNHQSPPPHMTHFPPSPGSVPMFWRECLHIGDAGSPEEVGDARPPHRGGHRLARGLDAGQQLRQVTYNVNIIIPFIFILPFTGSEIIKHSFCL